MIWIVTDHAEHRKSIATAITAKAYEVAEIDCSDELHRRLQFQRPKLIIIDCGLPDSFHTLDKIRADPRSRTIPLLMFSMKDEDLKQKALLKGADGYVGKGSLDWLELLTEVARLAGPPGWTKP